MKNSTNLFQLIFWVISSLLYRQSGTLAYGLIMIFPFPGMPRTSASFAQIMVLKHLRGYLTHHAALMAANASVGVHLNTLIPCLGVS